jgi:UDP-perosamine 4-acetyltransferase
MKRPIVVIGAGGHAKVLIAALMAMGEKVLGLVDADREKWGTTILEVPVLGDDREIFRYRPADILLVNGIGSVGLPLRRTEVFNDLKKKGYSFAGVIHPAAVLAPEVTLDEGVQIMAGAIVQPGCRLGSNVIINTGASVDHDCQIGSHAHLAPGVVLSGGVFIGEGAHIGTGAVVIQGLSIGGGSVVAAGAVVIRNVEKNRKVMGVPAREVE